MRRRSPMLASPDSASCTLLMDGYAYEPKYDGMRATLEVDGGQVSLWSREGNNKAAQFPEIVNDVKASPDMEVDGEIVLVDDYGKILPFQDLSARINLKIPTGHRAVFVAFDILSHHGVGYCQLPLFQRRALLEMHTVQTDYFRHSDHVPNNGIALYHQAVAEKWEGLIVKRLNSPYREGKRQDDWIKLKFVARQEFVVLGYTAPEGRREYFGSLVLAVVDNNRLRYVGNVGSGFKASELPAVHGAMNETLYKWVVDGFDEVKPVTWIQAMVAEVEFQEWTRDGKLRHPVWKGFRSDKDIMDVVRET